MILPSTQAEPWAMKHYLPQKSGKHFDSARYDNRFIKPCN